MRFSRLRACAAVLVVALRPFVATAQSAAPPRLPADLVAFFTGAWSCAGAFANGRPIASDMTFAPALDTAWLAGTHADRPPNRYAARLLWGAAADGLVETVADNFGGARRFHASPWRDGELAFVGDTTAARRERFTYRRLSDTTFRTTYDVSRDGRAWALGDSLTCTRSNAAAEIRAVLDSTAAGWNRGDLARYLWAYVDTATSMGSNGPERGIPAIEAQMRAGFWRTGRPLQMLHYQHVEVRPLGTSEALVTGQFVLTGGGRPDRTGWFTTVWTRTSAGWRMAHDHSG